MATSVRPGAMPNLYRFPPDNADFRSFLVIFQRFAEATLRKSSLDITLQFHALSTDNPFRYRKWATTLRIPHIEVKWTGASSSLHPILYYFTTLHYTTPHHTTLHYTTLHYTTLHYTTQHHTSRHDPHFSQVLFFARTSSMQVSIPRCVSNHNTLRGRLRKL